MATEDDLRRAGQAAAALMGVAAARARQVADQLLRPSDRARTEAKQRAEALVDEGRRAAAEVVGALRREVAVVFRDLDRLERDLRRDEEPRGGTLTTPAGGGPAAGVVEASVTKAAGAAKASGAVKARAAKAGGARKAGGAAKTTEAAGAVGAAKAAKAAKAEKARPVATTTKAAGANKAATTNKAAGANKASGANKAGRAGKAAGPTGPAGGARKAAPRRSPGRS
ncbi:MAG: hypothetical protein M0005_05310 [Actinomycetota bacterium]|nr:hypothetical protein [Actinomycetota bacterium]